MNTCKCDYVQTYYLNIGVRYIPDVLTLISGYNK